MDLNLTRPLIFFDIESTGLSIPADSIIELSFVKVFPGNPEPEVKTWKIRPWDYENNCQRHISEDASKVNGVHDEDLKGCPLFIKVAGEIAEWLKDSDLAGFNSAKFDLPLLAEEIERAREYCRERAVRPESREKAEAMLRCIEGIDLHEKKMVDVQSIYHHMEPRNLRAAYRFYCGGKDFENAHTAEADTLATYEVLKAQLDRYSKPEEYREEILKNDVGDLSKFGTRSQAVDYAGRLYYNDAGEAVISFGKHKGKTAREVYLTEPSYFAWINNGEFTLDTKRQFNKLKEQFDREKAEKRKAPASEEALRDLADKWNGRLF